MTSTCPEMAAHLQSVQAGSTAAITELERNRVAVGDLLSTVPGVG